jgi:hypothetical protein
VVPGEDQLGHGGQRRYPDHLGREARPDRIQVGQPVEQLAILRAGDGAREALVHVVVRVDQARDDHMVAGVDDLVGLLRKIFGLADLLDDLAPDVERAIGDLFTTFVHGDQDARVPDQQRLACCLLLHDGGLLLGFLVDVFDLRVGAGDGGVPFLPINDCGGWGCWEGLGPVNAGFVLR